MKNEDGGLEFSEAWLLIEYLIIKFIGEHVGELFQIIYQEV